MNRVYRLSLLMLLLAGCSTSAERQAPAAVDEVGGAEGITGWDVVSEQNRQGQKTTRQQTQFLAYRPQRQLTAEPTSAVLALVEEANRQQGEGFLQQAAATLERAVRIAPRNPQIWNRLARVRLQQGRVAMAGDLAAKSNALARGNPRLVRDNWLIIARARRHLGDDEGARLAERMAKESMP
jgi:hypothetical protein